MRSYGFALLALALVACAPPAAAPQGPTAVSSNAPSAPTTTSEQWTPVIPSVDLAPGPNRFTLGILDERNRPITDAKVHLKFFDLAGRQPVAKSAADATFRGTNLGDRGLYVAMVDFDRPGAWGVEIQAARPQREPRTLRTQFQVNERIVTPAIGSPAIPSKNPTLKDGLPLEKLSTALHPDPAFYQLSIAEALAQKRPLVVLFASPGFCQTATCQPSYDVLEALKEKFGSRVNFIHVEIYQDPAKGIVADTVTEWHLPSEPWLFLIDAGGKVVGKFEGGITAEEVEPAVAKLAS